MARFASIIRSGDKHTIVYASRVGLPDGSLTSRQSTATLASLPDSPAKLPSAVKAAAGGADKLTLESLDHGLSDGETGEVMRVHYGAAPAPTPVEAAAAKGKAAKGA